MKLEQSFEVAAPLERVWNALIDVEHVAPCLPGAAVTSRNEDGSYNGMITIKIGPTTANYAGKLEMQDIDESARSATMHAHGTDKRGQGGATATIFSSLREEGGVTHVDVITDYHITGRLARFGRGGMIEDVSKRLLREFAQRLQNSLVDQPAAAAAAAGAEPGPAGAGAPAAAAAGAGAEPAGAGPPAAAATGSDESGPAGAGGPAAAAAGAEPEVAGVQAPAAAATGAEPDPATAGPPAAPPAPPAGDAPAAAEPEPEPVPETRASAAAEALAAPVAPPDGGAPPATGSPSATGPTAGPQPSPGPERAARPHHPAEPIHGLSLAGSVIWERARRNPLPLVVGLLLAVMLLRVKRRRRPDE